jgi:hypothetical protein
MSKTFLRSLAGRNHNGLNHWLNAHRGKPRIAWYPSAGDDWRDLLFLSERYRHVNPALLPEPAEPDIFIHTDYLAGDYFNPFGCDVLIQHAHRTTITVLHEEVLPPLRIAFHPDLVGCHPSPLLGKVAFMILGVESDRLGHWNLPLIYAAVENTAMADLMLKRKARVSHIVQMRFGHSLGGGRIHPSFLRKLVEPLRTEAFVTDRHFGEGADGPIPHFESFNAHESVELNYWAVARHRNTVPWHGYDPCKFFVRPQHNVVRKDESLHSCRQCRLGAAVIERHREAVNAGSPLPPCDPGVVVKHHHGHRITVCTIDGWYQYHINESSIRVDRFSGGPEGRARYAAFQQHHGNENHGFGLGLQANGTRSVSGHTAYGAKADPAEYDRIAAQAVLIMKNLYRIDQKNPASENATEATHSPWSTSPTYAAIKADFQKAGRLQTLNGNSAWTASQWPNVPGVYLVWHRLAPNHRQLLYIGKTGKFLRDGDEVVQFNGGTLKSRLQRWTPYCFQRQGPHAQSFEYGPNFSVNVLPNQPHEDRYRHRVPAAEIEVECFLLGDWTKQLSPALLESLLLQEHLMNHDDLPPANNEL